MQDDDGGKVESGGCGAHKLISISKFPFKKIYPPHPPQSPHPPLFILFFLSRKKKE
jgi:hypothetical protein